jgi:uncharacterized protein (DUF433 family)
MTNRKRYPSELRERAVRLVRDQEKDHRSQRGAIRSVAEKIGCSGETLRGVGQGRGFTLLAPRLAVARRDSYSGAMTPPSDYRERIVVDPHIRFGKPTVRGTRITVGDVLDYLAVGMTETQLTEEFPQLSHEDVLACLAFAAERERRLAG